MAKADLLAVAFTDLNQNDKFNPGKDALIAALVDTNKDGAVSIGDTIQWGTYPAIPDGIASGTGGTYESVDSTITGVVVADSDRVVVNTALGRVEWSSTDFEEFRSLQSLGGGSFVEESTLRDSFIAPVEDAIFTNTTIPPPGGPGDPNTAINISELQPGDQAFLDVLILI